MDMDERIALNERLEREDAIAEKKFRASEHAGAIERLTSALKTIIEASKSTSDEQTEESLDTIGAAIELRLHILLDTAELMVQKLNGEGEDAEQTE